MNTWFASICVLAALPTVSTEVKLAQVGPSFHEAADIQHTAGNDREVVLIQGLCIHPFSSKNISLANWQRWQRPDCPLVRALAKESDVFAICYGQNVAVQQIAESTDFRKHIDLLKKAGYAEIVLIGHSAGGLVARHFVEDCPHSGVTKVIQVCTPNGGSLWGHAEIGVRSGQEEFLSSLTQSARAACLLDRCEKKIPDNVEFVCLVGHHEVHVDVNCSIPLWKGHAVNVSANKLFYGDGVISSEEQWTPDLQEQGIPAVALPVNHVHAMRSEAVIEKLSQLVKQEQARLSADEVHATRQELLGNATARASLIFE